MKTFFEEYGRTIVTVLIILGIILVGYTIAGNGRQSAFGRFTTDVVDSLSGQANDVLEGNTSGWLAANPDAQKVIDWGSETSKKIAGTGETGFVDSSYISVKNIDGQSPIPGKIHRVSLDGNVPEGGKINSGGYTVIKFRKSDGTEMEQLESGKKYKMLCYARGKGTWRIGPEQAEGKYYNLSDSWQRISCTFTTTASERAKFAQYRRNDAKKGEWCDVTNVYITEVK